MSCHLLLIPVGLCFVATQVWGEAVRPSLSKGVVTYEEDGQRKEIRVGKKCADLWVSPDESVIAFIGIEKAQPATADEIEPFIEESSIYIARQADHFKPVHIAVRVEISGRTWKVVREPKLSPDRSTVYFFVPNTMTTWKLMRTTVAAGPYAMIADATDYCVMWGGDHSGSLVLLSRRDPEPTANNPAPGVSYPCYVRSESGKQTKLADECFRDFDELARRWSREHGGTCH
jgi:hypothetical protein